MSEVEKFIHKRVGYYIGNDVYNRETDELGAIEDIVMDVQTGRIGFAVLRCRDDGAPTWSVRP